jgi:diguanylate cyclase (GGDEF)-like protein/PAS domain S-box-containing protein
MASYGWLRTFVVAACLAPLLVSPLLGAALFATGHAHLADVVHYVSGHALGNLIVTPVALMLSGRRARRETLARLRENRGAALLILFVSVSVSMLTFVQNTISMLFVSSLVAVASTVRLGREGAAVSIATIALIGAFMTGIGRGPVFLMPLDVSGQLLMFQFFLATTVLTVLLVAAELESRKRLLQQVRKSEAEFRMLAEYSTDAIMRIAGTGHINYVSPAIRELTGYLPDELVGQRSRVLLDPRDLDRVIGEHRQAMASGGGAHSYSYRIRRKDGEVLWLETHARAIAIEEETVELLAIMRDVTASREREAELSFAALTDRLTGLPNRRALEAAVAKLGAGDHCVALLDLDRFKQVNDTYGHDAGDAVLAGFAGVARRLVRSFDTVARLGGEEFVVLFAHTRLDQAYEITDRMRRIIGRTPLTTPAGPLRVTVSGGVAAIGRGGLAASLKAADEALYRAKKGGRDRLLLAA